MIGIIERVKNNVLLRCSNLNDVIINDTLSDIIDTSIYHFAEDVYSLINDLNINLSEEDLRNKAKEIIKVQIVKKIKRKLFIDSLALQITNDSYIEEYVNNQITLDKLKKSYIKELNKNKSSNQLNMTEDLDVSEIINELSLYFEKNVIAGLKENPFLVTAITSSVDKLKNEFENKLENMIKELDLSYLDILYNELMIEVKLDKEKEEGEIDMIPEISENTYEETTINKFDKYDDMTLFNKMILSLNTKEEELSRKERKLEKRKEEVEEKLSLSNKNIETNIERENMLSQKKLELNSKEVEINSKLSEAEVIFLNMKPLINGLNKIKASDDKGGNYNG